MARHPSQRATSAEADVLAPVIGTDAVRILFRARRKGRRHRGCGEECQRQHRFELHPGCRVNPKTRAGARPGARGYLARGARSAATHHPHITRGAPPTVASPRTEPYPLEELASAVSHQSTPPKRHPMAGPATVAAALPGRERRQAGLDRPGGPYGRCGRRWQRWTGIRRPPELAAQARGSRAFWVAKPEGGGRSGHRSRCG